MRSVQLGPRTSLSLLVGSLVCYLLSFLLAFNWVGYGFGIAALVLFGAAGAASILGRSWLALILCIVVVVLASGLLNGILE